MSLMSLLLNCKPVMNIAFNLQTTFLLIMLCKYHSQLLCADCYWAYGHSFFFLIFIFNCKVLTYNTYLQTMYDTYATNRTILYLQKKNYLQSEILTLLTILYSTYNTKLAILTYNEILTLLKVLYSTLYIYKTATCTTYITDYIRYKNRKKEKGGGGRGSMANFS